MHTWRRGDAGGTGPLIQASASEQMLYPDGEELVVGGIADGVNHRRVVCYRTGTRRVTALTSMHG